MDAVILDGIERMLGQSPYFGGYPKWSLLVSAGSGVPTQYNRYAMSYTGNEAMYNHVLDYFLFKGADAGNPVYNLTPENFTSGSNSAMVATDSSLNLKNFQIDSIGRVWATLSTTGGVSGLYLKGATIGSAWTKIVGAADNATLYTFRKTNGDIWYNDATAGNWYQLQNGSAGGVTTTPPTGLYTTLTPGVTARQSYFSPSLPIGLANSSSPIANANAAGQAWNSNTTFNSLDTAGNNWNNYFALHDNSATPSTATFKAQLPWESVMLAKFVNQLTWGAYSHRILRLNDTYALLALTHTADNAYNNYTTGTTSYDRIDTGERAKRKTTICLLNLTTWVIKYVGVVEVPSVAEGMILAANELASYMSLISARMKNSTLDLIYMGAVATLSASGANNGIMICSIPLVKLDF